MTFRPYLTLPAFWMVIKSPHSLPPGPLSTVLAAAGLFSIMRKSSWAACPGLWRFRRMGSNSCIRGKESSCFSIVLYLLLTVFRHHQEVVVVLPWNLLEIADPPAVPRNLKPVVNTHVRRND